MKVTHVTNMQEIEAAIGQNDLVPACTPLPDAFQQLFASQDF